MKRLPLEVLAKIAIFTGDRVAYGNLAYAVDLRLLTVPHLRERAFSALAMITVRVRGLDINRNISVMRVCLTDQILAIAQHFCEIEPLYSNVDPQYVRVLFAGRSLVLSRTVLRERIPDDATLYCLSGLRGD